MITLPYDPVRSIRRSILRSTAVAILAVGLCLYRWRYPEQHQWRSLADFVLLATASLVWCALSVAIVACQPPIRWVLGVAKRGPSSPEDPSERRLYITDARLDLVGYLIVLALCVRAGAWSIAERDVVAGMFTAVFATLLLIFAVMSALAAEAMRREPAGFWLSEPWPSGEPARSGSRGPGEREVEP